MDELSASRKQSVTILRINSRDPEERETEGVKTDNDKYRYR